MAESRQWWGDFRFDVDEGKRWQIGPLSLWIHRGSLEWHAIHDPGLDPMRDALRIADPAGTESPGPKASLRRYAFRRTPDLLRLLPALADRPVIVNPATPVFLPPGEEVVFYVSTPLWVQLHVGEPWSQLQEVATFRPTDTWFGPTTVTGELCYASKTSARLRLEDLPIRPHRAVSAVTIRNGARSVLPLERLKLPALNLSLYSSPNGHLWTNALILEREQDGDQAKVRLSEESVPGGATLVTGPRQGIEKGFLLEAFAGLFTKKTEKKDDAAPGKPGVEPDADA